MGLFDFFKERKDSHAVDADNETQSVISSDSAGEINAEIHANEAAVRRDEFKKVILKYLQSIGIVACDTNEYFLLFNYMGKNFSIFVDDEDFFNHYIVIDLFSDFEVTPDNVVAVWQVADSVMNDFRLVKLVLRGESLAVKIEYDLADEEQLKHLFPYFINLLIASLSKFEEEITNLLMSRMRPAGSDRPN